ncbi:MAG: SxtJ family membrane protein [bacterium]
MKSKPGRAEMRKFGLTLAVGLAVLGALLLWRGRSIYVYFFGAAAAFLVVGLIAPVALRPFQKFWMKLADLLGWVMTRVIMVALFFAVVTPIGLVARAVGKDFLRLKFDSKAKTYWDPCEPAERPKEHYERQY